MMVDDGAKPGRQTLAYYWRSVRAEHTICWTKRSSFSEGIDLGAYLISEGLALAGPDAPFEYRALERIAESNVDVAFGAFRWIDFFRFR